MLQSLRVKNLALMEETEVEFGRGLNILTGETGAGKSLLIGSVNLALGGKFDKDMLRQGADSAYVELVFTADDDRVVEKLTELDLDAEEGCVIISRKMQPGKSVFRINGETVTAKQVKELAEVLIDIHGQHEHQSLLHKKKHMEILDAFSGREAEEALWKVSSLYEKNRALHKKLEEESMDEAAKAKEQALAEFEYQEIENAALTAGEDDTLEHQYRFMVNSKKIVENLAESYRYTGNESVDSAGNSLSRALRAIRTVSMHDERLQEMEQQLVEVDNLLADYNRDVSEYMSDCEFDGEDFAKVEERLNTINRLKDKYGSTVEEILEYKQSRQELLEKLADYDSYINNLKTQVQETETALREACAELSAIRQREAVKLTVLLKDALVNLNFLTVEFEIAVRPEQTITAKGYDDVEFLISTNPGESLKALGQVASGGELSRVMLAIKTVLSGKDGIDTLIFDEIDAGISGRTAWKVAGQLSIVAKEHQVLCITHLPQIAAMADRHFVIEKCSEDGSTITDIRAMDEDESLAELARLLGSDALTEAALENARQMRNQALSTK